MNELDLQATFIQGSAPLALAVLPPPSSVAAGPHPGQVRWTWSRIPPERAFRALVENRKRRNTIKVLEFTYRWQGSTITLQASNLSAT